MSAQVLEISKHEPVTRPAAFPGRRARVYRFPSHTPLAELSQELAPTPRRSRFRLRLALELAIGLALWLTWLVWQHAH